MDKELTSWCSGTSSLPIQAQNSVHLFLFLWMVFILNIKDWYTNKFTRDFFAWLLESSHNYWSWQHTFNVHCSAEQGLHFKGRWGSLILPGSMGNSKLAANQGNAEAQHNLAVCFRNGRGVPQSYTESVKWYQLAAARNSTDVECSEEFKINRIRFNLIFFAHFSVTPEIVNSFREWMKKCRRNLQQGHSN